MLILNAGRYWLRISISSIDFEYYFRMLIPNVDSCHGRLSGVSFDLLLSFAIGFTIGRLLKEAPDFG